MPDIEKLLVHLYENWSLKTPDSVVSMPESGSYRRYFRISSGKETVLGVHNSDIRENKAFLYLDEQLLKTGNKVPQVYAHDLENNVYLEQDLGEVTLLDYLEDIRKGNNAAGKTLDIYRAVINAMPGLQVSATEGIDYSECYPRAEFDVQSMMWDMNYFKYCLLKPLKIGFFEQDLEDDFVKIVNWLHQAERHSFMFRDFQSRNIMVPDNIPYFIDFQGGRKGPLQYDLASLLFEAKTFLDPDIRDQLLEDYLSVFSKTFSWFRREEFLTYYYGFVYLRLMQAMGAYGFRGYIERKPLFLQSLPYALKILAWLMDNKPLDLKLASLPGVFEKLIGLSGTKQYTTVSKALVVAINSFSFGGEYPKKEFTNQHGFVFDCRHLCDPVHLNTYSLLTGKDKDLAAFFSGRSDIEDFIASISLLIDQVVDAMLEQEAGHLTLHFGCSDGKHRSVYLAERIAGHLRLKTNISTQVRHRELEKTR